MVKIEWDIKLGFQDVLIRPKRSQLRSRKDVKLVRTYKFLHSTHTWSGIPIVAANMDTTGTFEMAREFSKHKCMVAIHKHYTLTEWDNFIQKELSLNNLSIFNYIAVSAGTSDKDFIKLTKLLTTYKQLIFICLDIANGYSEHFVKYISKVRKSFTNHIIMAGNVVTQEMTEQLLLSGADIIKIGIGPGSVCTTRKKTGVGYPQLSAVLECADAAHGLGGLIVSDGGCTMPGDFGKAFGAGSDFVMAGGMFSGYDESGGELIMDNNTGKKYKKFYGMSSSEAMKKHSGGVANYRASEGKCVLVPYKGDINGCLFTLLGGLRSTCTYVGAKSLKELSKRTTFIRVQQHHNIVFGDEKNNNDNLINQNNKKPIKNKYPIFDPTNQSMTNLIVQKKALLQFLNNIDDNDNKDANDNKDGNDNDNDNNVPNVNNNNNKPQFDVFSAMSKEMKKEYFEWVYQKEQQKLKKQQQIASPIKNNDNK